MADRNLIEQHVLDAAQLELLNFVFEENNAATRAAVVYHVEDTIRRYNVAAVEVFCDERHNPPSVINNSELRAVITVKYAEDEDWVEYPVIVHGGVEFV